jgi:hypothetical protein
MAHVHIRETASSSFHSQQKLLRKYGPRKLLPVTAAPRKLLEEANIV